MSKCVKKQGKTSDVPMCPTFSCLGPPAATRSRGKSVEFGNFLGLKNFGNTHGNTHLRFFVQKIHMFFFLNTHVWWKKFSVSFLPSKNHDAFLLTLAVCCLPFSDTHLLAATGSYLAATWPQGGSVLKAPLIQWGSETRWRQIVRLGSTKSIA